MGAPIGNRNAAGSRGGVRRTKSYTRLRHTSTGPGSGYFTKVKVKGHGARKVSKAQKRIALKKKYGSTLFRNKYLTMVRGKVVQKTVPKRERV